MFISKKELRKIIREEIIDALTVKVTWEKRRDVKSGTPIAPEIKKERVFLPSFIAQNIKFQEGAFRGVQEDLGKKQGEITDATRKIEALANFLITAEPIFKKLAEFTNLVIEKEQKKIEHASNS